MTHADGLAMAEEWVCIENNLIMYNADIDDQLKALENDEEEDDNIEEKEIDDDEKSVVMMDVDDGDDGKQKAKVSFL